MTGALGASKCSDSSSFSLLNRAVALVMLCTSSPHRHFLPSQKWWMSCRLVWGCSGWGKRWKLPHCSPPNRLLRGDRVGSPWQALPCALICRQKVDVKLFILALCGGTWLTLGRVLSCTDDCLPLWCLSSPAGFPRFSLFPLTRGVAEVEFSFSRILRWHISPWSGSDCQGRW